MLGTLKLEMRLGSVALALLFSTSACATGIEGIKLAKRVQLGAAGPELVLNGIGAK